MPVGTARSFATDKGCGFIAPEDGGKDGFVHVSAVVQTVGLRRTKNNRRVSHAEEALNADLEYLGERALRPESVRPDTTNRAIAVKDERARKIAEAKRSQGLS